MRRAQGYAIKVDPAFPMPEERDTFTCAHCNCVVFVKPLADPSEMGGFCRMCMNHICKHCVATGECEPFEKKLEAMERTDRLRRIATTGRE